MLTVDQKKQACEELIRLATVKADRPSPALDDLMMAAGSDGSLEFMADLAKAWLDRERERASR